MLQHQRYYRASTSNKYLYTYVQYVYTSRKRDVLDTSSPMFRDEKPCFSTRGAGGFVRSLALSIPLGVAASSSRTPLRLFAPTHSRLEGNRRSTNFRTHSAMAVSTGRRSMLDAP